MAMILVKKLRNYLKDHIFPYQVAFILGRWIVDNTLIVQETALTISKKNKKKRWINGDQIGHDESL